VGLSPPEYKMASDRSKLPFPRPDPGTLRFPARQDGERAFHPGGVVPQHSSAADGFHHCFDLSPPPFDPSQPTLHGLPPAPLPRIADVRVRGAKLWPAFSVAQHDYLVRRTNEEQRAGPMEVTVLTDTPTEEACCWVDSQQVQPGRAYPVAAKFFFNVRDAHELYRFTLEQLCSTCRCTTLRSCKRHTSLADFGPERRNSSCLSCCIEKEGGKQPKKRRRRDGVPEGAGAGATEAQEGPRFRSWEHALEVDLREAPAADVTAHVRQLVAQTVVEK